MLYNLFLFFIFFYNILGFKPNNMPLFNNNLDKLSMTPNNMINLLTSIKEYTIITEGNSNKLLEELMLNNSMNVYYADVNNLLDKQEILSFLKKKYRNLESGENLWIFYKGFLLGSRESVYSIIKKKNKDII